MALSWLSSYGVGSGQSSESLRPSKNLCANASSAVRRASASNTSIFSSRSTAGVSYQCSGIEGQSNIIRIAKADKCIITLVQAELWFDNIRKLFDHLLGLVGSDLGWLR